MDQRAPRRNSRELFWDRHSGGQYETIAPPMNPVLKLLTEGGHLTAAQMAQVAGISESEVNQQLEELKRERCV